MKHDRGQRALRLVRSYAVIAIFLTGLVSLAGLLLFNHIEYNYQQENGLIYGGPARYTDLDFEIAKYQYFKEYGIPNESDWRESNGLPLNIQHCDQDPRCGELRISNHDSVSHKYQSTYDYREASSTWLASAQYKSLSMIESNARAERDNYFATMTIIFRYWIPVTVTLIVIPCIISFFIGLEGGWILTKKKLRGTNPIIVLLVVIFLGSAPLFAWLLFMFVMGISGVWGMRLALSTRPAKKQCVECRGWNDFRATRCMHCTQPLTDAIVA